MVLNKRYAAENVKSSCFAAVKSSISAPDESHKQYIAEKIWFS